MYKHSGLLVIAALVISTMGILAPTTTVTAADPTVTLTPATVRDNGYVWFTLTVTNPSDSGENVKYILVQDVTTGVSSWFSGGICGENVAENIDNLAENLKAVGSTDTSTEHVSLGYVADNLEEALVNIQAAADMLIEGANLFANAGENLKDATSPSHNAAGAWLVEVQSPLATAGSALKVTGAIDFVHVADNLTEAASKLQSAGNALKDNDNCDDLTIFAADNLQDAAHNLNDWFAENLRNTIFSLASDNDNGLTRIADSLDNVGCAMILFGADTGYDNGRVNNAGNALENAAECLLNAAENLLLAGENIKEAGAALRTVENNYLENIENLPLRCSDDDTGETNTAEVTYLVETWTENILFAALALENGSGDLGYENLLRAGDALGSENGATVQDQNYWLGTELASNIIGYYGELVKTTARYWLGEAGDCLRRADNVDLTAAASAIDNAASRFVAAGNKVDTIATTLSPTAGWGGTTVGATGAYSLLFVAFGTENHIAPGGSKTFSFLWKAPDISTSEDHLIRVWTKNQDNSALGGETDFTVTVDGEAPMFSMKITQSGVADYLGTAVDNLIGQVYPTTDPGKATLQITAEEAITAFGTIRIENWKVGEENLLLTYSDFTISSDSKVFTYDFYTTDWQENAENIYVVIEGPCATDANGVENEETVSIIAWVDLVQPVLQDNGLNQFMEIDAAHKPGDSSDNEYHLTYQKRWTITGTADDNENESTSDPLWAITTIYANDTALTMARLDNNDFSATDNLPEGQVRLRVRTVDRVGLWVENELENVFVDNLKPTCEGVSITGGSPWTDNSLTISDNKPTIRLKIQDPGYPTTGWGIPENDNVLVYLVEDLTVWDSTALTGYVDILQNAIAWDNGEASGEYNFENTYDNDNKGLTDNAPMWVVVVFSDNVPGHDNDNWLQSFQIDVTSPTVSTPTAANNPLDGTTISDPLVQTANAVTIRGTGLSAEVGATINIYIKDATTLVTASTETTTVDNNGNWLKTITIPASGTKYQIEVSCTDEAGNESSTVLYGYVMIDGVAPTVSISAPVAAGGTYTTDQASVSVTGTVTKDTWEIYNAGTMNVTATVQIGSATAGTVTINSDGSFTVSAALSEGTNSIVIRATDTASNIGSATITVSRTVTPWATYAIIIVIVALILAAIAIFRKR